MAGLLRLIRRLWLVFVLGAAVWLAGTQGRFAAGVAAIAAAAIILLVYIILPRAAHRAFERGDHGRAAFCYRLIRVFVVDRESRGSIEVSLAGCHLARGEHEQALTLLGAVDPSKLGASARAAWLNNRAYALARRGGDPAALPTIDDAVRLRPDVAGFRHTRGVVLLALGRIDDAIAELDEVWRRLSGEDAPPLLEAERCYDLGVAWSKKGEVEYARDYFARAQLVAPRSPWAVRSAAASASASGAVPVPAG